MAIESGDLDYTYAFGPGMGGGSSIELYRNKNFDLQTARGDKPIRLNSRNTAETSGNLIGVQCKPGGNGGAGATASVKGAEFQPRFLSLTSGGSLIGIDVSPILKGTTGADGNLSGALRGVEINLTDDNAGTRTITGASAAIRIFQQMTSKTFTNGLFALQIEAAGSGVAWTAAALFPNDSVIAATTGSPANLPANTAWVKVQIGTSLFRLPGYHPTT